MRVLLLAVLALAAVVLGATREPHGGCDYDFGAGNGTAYLVVNNPYNLNLSLIITYQRGEHKYSEVRNILNTRVIVFCGLGHGWLYIQQNASQLRSPLAWYPLAVPRYTVLRAGESATIFVTTLLAPAVTISIAILLIVAITLRPRLRRSAVYALPDTLRGMDIRELVSTLFSFIFTSALLYVLLVYEWPPSLELAFSNISSLFNIYVLLTLGSFYLSFRRGLWTYYFLFISFLINGLLIFKAPNSLVLFALLFIWSITILPTSSVTLLSFYNLLVVVCLLTYGIAVFIYYDMNFGYAIPWSLPLQTPVIFPVQATLHLPEILVAIIPIIVAFVITFLVLALFLVYNLTMHARAVTSTMVFWPPLWWWFGLGVFAWDELEARNLLHRLSAGGTVVIELSRGERAFVVSSDLNGMYLCRFGRWSGVCNDVEWVSYDEVKFNVMTIKRSRERHVVGRFVRKVILPTFIIFFSFCMINYKIKYTELIMFLLITLLLTTYYRYNDFRELMEYVKDIIKQKKVLVEHLILHIFWAFILTLIFLPLQLNDIILYVFLTGIVVSFLSRADPELSRYLFPWLEIRLMSVGGLVIGLARGGCFQRAKVGVAPQGHDIVIWDEDCLVVVSPYVERMKSRPQRNLCGPACSPVRVVVEKLHVLINTRQPHSHKKPMRDVDWKRVAVNVVDVQGRRHYHYVIESSR